MEMETTIMTDRMILVRGGGDLATGVIHKLHQSGYHILILECDRPSAIRRHVAFCEAVYDGTSEVEGVVLVDLHEATANGEVIQAKYTPKSGYFKIDPENMNLNAVAYETVSN